MTIERPDEWLERKQERDLLNAALAVMPEQWHDALVKHFGLGADEPMTMTAIGHGCGRSCEAIRQRVAKALCWLSRSRVGQCRNLQRAVRGLPEADRMEIL